MDQSPQSHHKGRIILLSALIVIATGAITIFILKGINNVAYQPTAGDAASSSEAVSEEQSAGDKKLQKANELLAAGEIDAAITEFEEARSLYQQENDEQGAQDATFQIESLTAQQQEESRLTEEQESRRTSIQTGTN